MTAVTPSNFLTGIGAYTYYLNSGSGGVGPAGTGQKDHVLTFNQSVIGCPLEYSVQRTPVATGVRRAADSFETPVLSVVNSPRKRGGSRGSHGDFHASTYCFGKPCPVAKATSTLTETFRVNTQNIAYDLQLWNVNFVQTSTYSTHANKDGVYKFNLTIKDKCWDVDLIAPVATVVPTLRFKLWHPHSIPFSQMTMSFGGVTLAWNYCSGFEYELERVTSPNMVSSYQYPSGNVGATSPLFTQTDFDTAYVPKTQATDTNLKYDYTPTAFQWVGTHTMRIIGKVGNDPAALKVDGKYVAKSNPTNSDPITVANKWKTGSTFTVVIYNPCDTTVVDSIT